MVSGNQINMMEYWKTEFCVSVWPICILCGISLETNEALNMMRTFDHIAKHTLVLKSESWHTMTLRSKVKVMWLANVLLAWLCMSIGLF